jgi:SAM-dependent methyltransferase
MNPTVSFNHAHSPSSADAAYAALSKIFPDVPPSSLLDVGCGTGTWLSAAERLGVSDLHGVDGIDANSSANFSKLDLTQPIRLGRRYDVVLCLEVGEHLDSAYSRVLIGSLVAHAPKIIFSAACPGQPGQHHVNCQWPDYWQSLFNREGFACYDTVRWSIWNDKLIEPWYRQNMFIATYAPSIAGNETRIAAVVHPDMLRVMFGLSRHVLAPWLPGIRWARWIAMKALQTNSG